MKNHKIKDGPTAGLLLAPGTMVPPLTPFDADLHVDYAKLKTSVDYVVDVCGASLVIAAGVEAQEYQFLPHIERCDLVRATIDAVAGRRPVAAGISHPSFKIAVELAHVAERHGASAVQLLAPRKPTGGAHTHAELIRYFELVARETSLPIVLYLNAGPGEDVSIPLTIELAQIEAIQYIKESSRDLSRVSRLIAEIDHAGHARYYTTMQMLLISLQLGGSGVTLPAPAAHLARLIMEAYSRGDLASAIEGQKLFATFPSRWMQFGLAAVMKAASAILGADLGDPYPPYGAVVGKSHDDLRVYLTAFSQHLKEKTHA
ncbi:dihydrodipicolinate synthase family protein [Beijerinckia sp. L45]|uniref:dihydrodipicolinate synthase family protein n=1 Tax=Beijerinckia sp. L45 TaxID=1641855 RepID=UPI00131DD0DD|nr:dihydrodipicolinate synthase family protein [Beijerinckia sp. L45]